MPSSRTLFVGNLSYRVSEEELDNLLSKTSRVKRVYMRPGPHPSSKNKGYAFVEFFSHEDARKVLATHAGDQLDERPLRLDWHQDRADFEEHRRQLEENAKNAENDAGNMSSKPVSGGYGKSDTFASNERGLPAAHGPRENLGTSAPPPAVATSVDIDDWD